MDSKTSASPEVVGNFLFIADWNEVSAIAGVRRLKRCCFNAADHLFITQDKEAVAKEWWTTSDLMISNRRKHITNKSTTLNLLPLETDRITAPVMPASPIIELSEVIFPLSKTSIIIRR